jgi:LPXTG-motif cell wall-anchored protein
VRIAGALAGAGVLLALAIAPQVDRAEPLIDYEQIVADNLQSGSSTEFDWSHDYGPLEWPRDGREVLRVKAQRAAYWKATVLSDFDGTAWVQGRRNPPGIPDTEFTPDRRARDRLEVVVRNLESSDYVAAGTTVGVQDSPRLVRDAGSGTFRTGSRPLRKGDTYRADVYVPRPGSSRLREAGTDYPSTTQPYMTMRLPETSRRVEVLFPVWGDDDPTYAIYGRSGFSDERGEQLVASSPYARTYALAQRLRAQSSDPYDFARRVRARVQSGATYTESPAPRRHPLDAFLFDAREGYCQQFSGAMALLLRMGGVPARVAAGFTSGTYDDEREQWVVRDVDAHAWVEAYFPGEGWIAFDPTPEVAPPRSQLPDPQEEQAEEEAEEESAGDTEDPAAQTEEDAAAAAADPDDSETGGARPAWPIVVGLAFALVLLGVVLVRRRTRRDIPPADAALEELRRALRRAGREPAPGATLSALERELGDGGYVAALRAARYGPPDDAAAGPTGAQRRALRHALAAGGGLRARVRSWWALPPRTRTG